MRFFRVVALLGLVFLAGCGKSDSGGSASGTLTVLNGASPHARDAGAPFPGSRAGANWQLSPNKIILTLNSISFLDAAGSNNTANLTNCTVTYDRTQPGLTKFADCAISIPTGTFTRATLSFASSYQILVDDSTNGIYTNPSSASKFSTTGPGQLVTVTATGPTNGGATFSPPLTVNSGDSPTISVVVNGLQFFQVNVNGAAITLGADGGGSVGFPDTTLAVGTPAALAYYVKQGLGTALSYNATAMGSTLGQGIYTVSVLYSGASTPYAIGVGFNGQPSGCGPFGVGFYFQGPPPPKGGGGYVGQDSNGVLGWAATGETGTTWSTFSSVLNMAAKTTLGDTTTLNCLTTTTDPNPPGGTFSSGAPVIPSPTLHQTMKLVAQ